MKRNYPMPNKVHLRKPDNPAHTYCGLVSINNRPLAMFAKENFINSEEICQRCFKSMHIKESSNDQG